MSLHLQRDLEALHHEVLSQAGRVEQMIYDSVSALCDRRYDLVASVVAQDDVVDKKEVQVEEECLKLLALHQPVARDLRHITTIQVQGHTDLAIGGRKFSGNAQRRKRTHLLFHGAILLNLDLQLLDQVLPMPTLQPDYRSGRSHKEFLTQLSVSAESVKHALRAAWSAEEPLEINSRWPDWHAAIQKLTAEKYSNPSWNLRA